MLELKDVCLSRRVAGTIKGSRGKWIKQKKSLFILQAYAQAIQTRSLECIWFILNQLGTENMIKPLCASI